MLFFPWVDDRIGTVVGPFTCEGSSELNLELVYYLLLLSLLLHYYYTMRKLT